MIRTLREGYFNKLFGVVADPIDNCVLQ